VERQDLVTLRENHIKAKWSEGGTRKRECKGGVFQNISGEKGIGKKLEMGPLLRGT